MRTKSHSLKCVLCIVLTLVMVVSMAVYTTMQFSAASGKFAATSADTYYLWGQNTNGPNFSSMSGPTGTFKYDSTLGYYYYDVESFSGGDYTFVISTNGSSGSSAVGNQATSKVAQSGSYYLKYGNYAGNACFQFWNDSKAPVRIYFTSATAGVNVIALSSVGGSETTAPTTKPTTTPTPTTPTPTQPGGSSGGSTTGDMVYCRNTAGWPTVSIYMWNGDGADKNAEWPGKPMTHIGDDIWQYEVPSSYANLIFSGGGTQTANLTYQGNGYIYDNSSNKWEIYDTSVLKVKSFGADQKSPQYVGTGITLTATAEGIGTVSYKFSVAKGSGAATVISDYSVKNSVIWTPTAVGTYTITYEFKDTMLNTNERTMTYEIIDDSGVVKPILKSVSPAPGQVKKGTQQTFTVTASGGNTGTKLLFYKFTITDPSGKTANVPYYTKTKTYKFTPTALGTYKVKVSVQGSDNALVEREYEYISVNEITDDPIPTTPIPTETQKPTTPGDVTMKGDSDEDGEVTILDATMIQRYLAKLITENGLNLANAETDGDNEITILDATMIQRYLAKLITW